MSERIIYFDGIDPVDIYGVNNAKLERLKNFFSKLKIVARGNELKAIGEESELELFGRKIQMLIDHFHQYNIITNNDFERIILVEDSDAPVGNGKREEPLLFGNNGKLIRARTPNQLKMVEDSQKNDLLFAIGPAGTGKTYTAIALAVRALKNREVKKIVLSRPAVEAGENLGFLPGDLKEKIDPYLIPLYDALDDMIPSKKLKDMMEEGIIQIAPLAFMRGRTLENAFVILDEAQNATLNQFKMFVTRMGMNAKFIVTGDITQIDLPKKSQSGLLQALTILEGIKGISVIRFNEQDIVRHPLVKKIVAAYDKLYKDKVE
ncbi:MAG: PhoH family protein [Bacteroidales bacterium]|nr:PhoH family protein [Bacteroidales bacterium]MCF8455304.1 PhoH family protein [Bacteroidales bacterium]